MGTTCEFSGPDQASHEVDTSLDTFVWKPLTLVLIQEWVLVQDILQFKTERLVKYSITCCVAPLLIRPRKLNVPFLVLLDTPKHIRDTEDFDI